MASISSRTPLSLSNSTTMMGHREAFGLCYFGLTRRLRQVVHLMQIKDEPITSHLTSRLMSIKYNGSTLKSEGLCKIFWSIEAIVSDGCIIFLTGDPFELGSWDQSLAIPLSQSLVNNNLWETQIMVPYGTHFKYNYFIKNVKYMFNYFYRRGPRLYLSIPNLKEENKEIRVRDCWLNDVSHRIPAPSFDSWLFDLSGEQNLSKSISINCTENKTIDIKEKPPERYHYQPIRKAPPIESTEIKANGIKEDCTEIKAIVAKEGKLLLRDQPIEEPWLLTEELDKEKETLKIPKRHKIQEIAGIQNKEKETLKISKRNKIQEIRMKILINSSTFNMRRIAVLENEKPVELILEPEKDDVSVNNIYLGVINKISTQKGGAFIDIGLSEPAFMAMKENMNYMIVDNKKRATKEIWINGGKNGEVIEENKLAHVKKDAKIIVQVNEIVNGMVNLVPYSTITSRFWMLRKCNDRIDVSSSVESLEEMENLFEEIQKDLKILLATWVDIEKKAKLIVQASKCAVPILLYRALDQNLNLNFICDYFRDEVESLLVDSYHSYHEVIINLQKRAPELCARVKLYNKKSPILDKYKIEEEFSRMVQLPDGGNLVIEQTEAFVSIDVNSGSQSKISLDVNLAAAKQIARELRLRDIGGVIIVDFIDMFSDSNKRLLYEEMKRAVERDRSTKVTVSEISSLGLMEITREKVNPNGLSLTSEPCECCDATGRVKALEHREELKKDSIIKPLKELEHVEELEKTPNGHVEEPECLDSLETSFAKIKEEIYRFLEASNLNKEAKTTPTFLLKVDRHMCEYLTSGKTKKFKMLTSSLNVSIQLKTFEGYARRNFELMPLGD